MALFATPHATDFKSNRANPGIVATFYATFHLADAAAAVLFAAGLSLEVGEAENKEGWYGILCSGWAYPVLPMYDVVK